MTVCEAAELMGCTPRHLRHLCETGRVESEIVTEGAKSRYEVFKWSIAKYRKNKSLVGFPAGAKRDGVRGKILKRAEGASE